MKKIGLLASVLALAGMGSFTPIVEHKNKKQLQPDEEKERRLKLAAEKRERKQLKRIKKDT